MGSAENLSTDIPGLTLHRRTAPTAPLSVTYEPSVAVVVQGRKRVELGRTTFVYDASRFLITSVDLPVVSHVIEASEGSPYLCFRLKLQIPIVGELLSRGAIPATDAPPDGPAMATSKQSQSYRYVRMSWNVFAMWHDIESWFRSPQSSVKN